jgi:Lrp/AsnC family transcriptional regulator, leucine-responsive regulatory protein
MDELDQRIVQILRKDARLSCIEVAKQLKVSPATIRRRINDLTNVEGLRFTAMIDPGKMGMPIGCILLLNVELYNLQTVWETFNNYPETRWASYTTGEYNLFFMLVFPKSEDVLRFIQNRLIKTEGIISYKTVVGLNMKIPSPNSFI